jgi:hypothetical protein
MSADYRGQQCVCAGKCLSEALLSRRQVSLDKTKAVRLTYLITSAHRQSGKFGGGRHCLKVAQLRIVDVRGNILREVVRRYSQSVAYKGFREKTGGTKIEDHYLVIEQLEVAGVDIDGVKVKRFVLEADVLISVVSKDLSRP